MSTEFGCQVQVSSGALKIAGELKCRKEGNGTTELESDLFIVSLERETW